MKVCIAEKPSVAGEIAKIIGANSRKNGYYEGNGYQVTWTFGHLCTLNEPGDYDEGFRKWNLYALPIQPKEFKIKIINDSGVENQFNKIKSLVQNATEIINCGDAGQEGELIQRWVLQHAGCTAPIKRLWISSLTEEAIKNGFKNLMEGSDFDALFEAGKSRAISDWLYGINATRLYTLKFGKNKQVLSVGRVQTPTLAMIVKRHFDIKNFVPNLYFEIKTEYKSTTFTFEKGKIEKKIEAEQVLEKIKKESLSITEISVKAGKEHPPNLFDLTSLQVEGNKKLGLSAEQTLNTVQSLYEKKLVSYPRVDTVYLPKDQYPKIKGILKGLVIYQELTEHLIQKPIKKSKKVFNDNKVTDHHAIIPTGINASNISGNEAAVYDIISRRFIAAFYPECKVSNTTVNAEVCKLKFKATGKQILDQGWRVVYQSQQSSSKEDKILPHFEKGESGSHTPSIGTKKTSPPKHYTEATLLRAMETAGKEVDDDELKQLMKENGIGRPSTRANIIETLFRRNYIEKKKKTILPTEIGIKLIQLIDNPTLKSPRLTGQWEKKMKDIEAGEFSSDEFIGGMRKLVSDLVNEVSAINPHASVLTCPKCECGKIIKGKSAYGCTEWVNGCTFKIPFEINKYCIDSKIVGKLIHQRKVTLAKDSKGNETIALLKSDFETEIRVEKPLNCLCPKCNKGRIKKGKSAFGCSEFKKTCDFLIPFTLLPEETPNSSVEKFIVDGQIQTSERVLKFTSDFGIESE
ncbi:MAG: DNA topoisomerase III [Flavobacteriales bacterium]|nr:DNA topoisomerase III [Flavobacteriales bacterium]|tara:strand:+ start:28300 stop:30537 length:2238 start_codon:yes stop_codon:yes gene_type:complete